jgi:hypothetical protein
MRDGEVIGKEVVGKSGFELWFFESLKNIIPETKCLISSYWTSFYNESLFCMIRLTYTVRGQNQAIWTNNLKHCGGQFSMSYNWAIHTILVLSHATMCRALFAFWRICIIEWMRVKKSHFESSFKLWLNLKKFKWWRRQYFSRQNTSRARQIAACKCAFILWACQTRPDRALSKAPTRILYIVYVQPSELLDKYRLGFVLKQD